MKRKLEEGRAAEEAGTSGGGPPEKNPNLIKRNVQTVLADLNELGKAEPAFWPCVFCLRASKSLIGYRQHLLQYHAVTLEQVSANKKALKTTVAFQEEGRKMKAATAGGVRRSERKKKAAENG